MHYSARRACFETTAGALNNGCRYFLCCLGRSHEALACIYRVPALLSDQQLIVPDGDVTAAAKLICDNFPYMAVDNPQDEIWKDFRAWNAERPYAFQNTPSIMLHHTDPPGNHLPCSILIHSASLFHFNIQDLSRTVTDPNIASKPVRFPSVPAFYDAVIETVHEPPSEFVHRRLYNHLLLCQANLTYHTVSDKGVCTTKTGELIPACLRVLEEVKEENRPYLKCHFLWKRNNSFEDGAAERILIKMESTLR